MKVIIRPLLKEYWSGQIRFKNCFDSVGPYPTRSGGRYTGLTTEDAERIGDRVGKDLRVDSTFWDTFHIKFNANDYWLDTEDVHDELKYLFLKKHKRVAPSLSEVKPQHDYVIINYEDEAKEVNSHNKLKRRAIKEFDKMSPEEMRRCIRLYGNNGDGLSNEVIEQRLYELVEGSPSKFLEKWVENSSRETEYIIAQAIAKNIVRKNKTMYKFGEDVIGYTLEDAVSYLDDPKHTDLKKTILQEIKSTK